MGNTAELVEKKIWAVVGANNNHDKFGYKIFKFMQDAGYEVYPVNPGLDEVMGKVCYKSVKDLPVKPDVVDVVVAPRVGQQVVKECAEAGIQNVWLQPGADAKEVVKTAEELGLNATCACIMVEARRYGKA